MIIMIAVPNAEIKNTSKRVLFTVVVVVVVVVVFVVVKRVLFTVGGVGVVVIDSSFVAGGEFV